MVWFGNSRGENLLDGAAHFYDTYETSDGHFMAVGALEPNFYSQLLIGLGLDPNDEENSQLNMSGMKTKFESLFKTKTQKEWTEIFSKLDACCTPVLNWDSAYQDEHNQQRKNFSVPNEKMKIPVPMPAPRFSASKMPSIDRPMPIAGEHSVEVLRETGYNQEQIDHLLKTKAVVQMNAKKSKL